MAFTILLRFRAMAARRHSSVAARMPLFRILEIQCSRFKTEKLPSAQILRSRIDDAKKYIYSFSTRRRVYKWVDLNVSVWI